jgi:cysteinyl-tRNA synthetase
MEAIVALIAELIARDHAYVADGDVYFAVRSDPEYGRLSHRDPDEMDQGEGLEGSERKRDPLDFALWKGRKQGEDTAWDSPWGPGRPGWHIECSAMAEQLLGVGFEVHGGGSDLIFPHHENEAAQTRAARGRELAGIWMHNGMVQLDEEKMAKSAGNIRLLHVALDEYGRDALVMYLCGGHYRQPLAFSPGQLEEAASRVARLREAGRRLGAGSGPDDLAPLRERFFAALAADFNTADALGAAFEWVREANRRLERGEPVGGADLREMLGVLGLDNLLDAGPDAEPDARVRELVARTPAAYAALLGALRRHKSQLDTFLWDAPPDDPLWHTAAHWDLKVAWKPPFSGRVVDLPAALALLRPDPMLAGRCVVQIEDALAPWNTGRWKIAVEGGAATAARGDATPDAACDIGGWSQLFFGDPDAEAPRRAGRLSVTV